MRVLKPVQVTAVEGLMRNPKGRSPFAARSRGAVLIAPYSPLLATALGIAVLARSAPVRVGCRGVKDKKNKRRFSCESQSIEQLILSS